MTISFTEKALLHPLALNLLYPSNSEKKIISSTSLSVSETLNNAPLHLYSHSPIQSSWHDRMKPVRFIGRGVYTVLVLTIISPLGAIFNGAMTIGCIGNKLVHKFNSESTPKDSEKINAYAKAFFTDLSCFAVGLVAHATAFIFSRVFAFATLGLVLRKSHYEIADNYVKYLAYSYFPLFASFLHGSFNSELSIPRLVANKDQKVGMFLSLASKNELGFVGEDNKLLPYSDADKMDYYETRKEYSYNKTSYNYHFFGNSLFQALIKTEGEFIVKIHKIKDIISDSNPYLSIDSLKNYIQNLSETQSENFKIELKELLNLYRKLQTLRKFTSEAKKISVSQHSFPIEIIKEFGSQSSSSFEEPIHNLNNLSDSQQKFISDYISSEAKPLTI